MNLKSMIFSRKNTDEFVVLSKRHTMYRKLTDFYQVWAYESESTLKLFKAIPQANFKNTGTESIRSIARLSWHITESIAEMFHHAGISVDGIADASKEPNDVQKLIAEYERSSKSLVEKLKEQWSDAELEDKVNMYGDQWEKGMVLCVLVRHQAHHRGQLTILMREEGLVVPGMYGPAKEEWVAMGMDPMV